MKAIIPLNIPKNHSIAEVAIPESTITIDVLKMVVSPPKTFTARCSGNAENIKITRSTSNAIMIPIIILHRIEYISFYFDIRKLYKETVVC